MKVFFRVVYSVFIIGFFSVACASTIARPVINSNLAGYWNFEDVVQTGYAYDRSGNSQTGVLTNSPIATTSTPGLGQALSFDGTNKYVSIPSHLNIGTANFSIVGWAYVSNTTNHGAFIKIGGVNGGVGIGLSPNDNTGFEQAGNTLTVLYEDVRWIPTGRNFGTGWHQFGLVVNGSGYPSIYLDGQLIYSDTSASTPQSPGSSLTQIGGYTSGIATNRFFNGSLDEIRIYNRVLSSDEIQRLYRLQKPRVSGGVSNTGLIGYWKMDEGSGSVIGDSSGNKNNGALTGGWTTGKNGKAIDLSSGSNYATIPDNVILRSDAISISLWFYLPNTSNISYYSSLITKPYTSSPWSPPFLSWLIRFNFNAHTLEFGIGNGTTYSGHEVTLGSDVIYGQWHHIAMTYDGNTIRPYLDDVALVSSNVGLGNIGYANYPIIIGADYASSPLGEYFPGYIDEVRLYSRVLSSAEIHNLYKNTKATVVNKTNTSHIKDGLVGHWTFDGSKISGVTAYDSSASANNGTLTNGPVASLGRIGQALKFDGSDDYVYLPTNFGLNLSSGVKETVSLWFKTTSTAGPVIFNQNDNTSIPLTPTSFIPVLAVQTDGKLRGEFWTGSNGQITSTGSVNDGVWHHAVMVGDDSYQSLYLDGALVGSRAGTINQSWWVNTVIGTGYNAGIRTGIGTGGWNYLPGSVDDVRMYNRALSADEIKALYNMGR